MIENLNKNRPPTLRRSAGRRLFGRRKASFRRRRFTLRIALRISAAFFCLKTFWHQFAHTEFIKPKIPIHQVTVAS